MANILIIEAVSLGLNDDNSSIGNYRTIKVIVLRCFPCIDPQRQSILRALRESGVWINPDCDSSNIRGDRYNSTRSDDYNEKPSGEDEYSGDDKENDNNNNSHRDDNSHRDNDSHRDDDGDRDSVNCSENKVEERQKEDDHDVPLLTEALFDNTSNSQPSRLHQAQKHSPFPKKAHNKKEQIQSGLIGGGSSSPAEDAKCASPKSAPKGTRSSDLSSQRACKESPKLDSPCSPKHSAGSCTPDESIWTSEPAKSHDAAIQPSGSWLGCSTWTWSPMNKGDDDVAKSERDIGGSSISATASESKVAQDSTKSDSEIDNQGQARPEGHTSWNHLRRQLGEEPGKANGDQPEDTHGMQRQDFGKTGSCGHHDESEDGTTHDQGFGDNCNGAEMGANRSDRSKSPQPETGSALERDNFAGPIWPDFVEGDRAQLQNPGQKPAEQTSGNEDEDGAARSEHNSRTSSFKSHESASIWARRGTPSPVPRSSERPKTRGKGIGGFWIPPKGFPKLFSSELSEDEVGVDDTVGGDETRLASSWTESIHDDTMFHSGDGPRPYLHRIHKPRYRDTLEDPYAVFIFHVRDPATIQAMGKSPGPTRSASDDRERLLQLPKSELVERLLQMKQAVQRAINPDSLTFTTAVNDAAHGLNLDTADARLHSHLANRVVDRCNDGHNPERNSYVQSGTHTTNDSENGTMSGDNQGSWGEADHPGDDQRRSHSWGSGERRGRPRYRQGSVGHHDE